MSSNLDQLKQKFDNYKKFIKENAKNSMLISVFEGYSYKQFVTFSVILLNMTNQKKLDILVNQTMNELQIDESHKDKITKYYNCFVDYLKIIPKEELQNI